MAYVNSCPASFPARFLPPLHCANSRLFPANLVSLPATRTNATAHRAALRMPICRHAPFFAPLQSYEPLLLSIPASLSSRVVDGARSAGFVYIAGLFRSNGDARPWYCRMLFPSPRSGPRCNNNYPAPSGLWAGIVQTN